MPASQVSGFKQMMWHWFSKTIALLLSWLLMLPGLVFSTELKLNDEEKQWLLAHPLIQVGADQNWPPFDFVDSENQHQGISADYLELISDYLGVKFKVSGKQWKEVIAGIKNGSFDMLACAANTEERRKYLLFSDPYILIDTVIVQREDQKPVVELSGLSGKTVALPKGTYIHEMLVERFPDIRLKFVKSNQDALQAVALGQADAYVGNLAVVVHFVEKDLLTNLKITSRVEGEKSALSFAVHHQLPILQSILKKTLAVIDEQQRLQIRKRWIPLAHDRFEAQPKPLTLTDAQQQWLKQHPVISIGTESDWPPYDFVDQETGQYQGITADFLALIEKSLGVKFKTISQYSWAEMLDKARDKQIDIVGTIVKTADREQYWSFSDAYFKYPDVIYTRTDSPVVKGLADLTGLSVAIEKGFYLEQMVLQENPEVRFHYVKNTEQAVEALSFGLVDAYIGNQGAANWWIAHNALTNLKVASRSGFQQTPIRFAVRKDWPMLTELLDLALAAISVEQRNVIKNKWLGVKAELDDRFKLSTTQSQWLAQHSQIAIGVDPNWPPIEFFDNLGRYRGIASEYVHLMEKKLNVEMLYDAEMDWQQVMEAMRRQEIDVLPAVSITPQREKYLLFTRPYLKFPYVVFTRDDAPLITGLDELDGATLVVERHYANHELLVANNPGIHLLLVDDTAQALSAISLGKADAYMGNLAATSHILVNNGLTNIKVAAPTPYSNDLAFAVRKDWPELKEILQEVLDSIPPEQNNAFKKKWFAIRYSHEIDYRLVWNIVLGGLLLLLLFSIWLWIIRRQKQALALSDQRFHWAMNAAKEGLWDWDIQTGAVYFSPGYFEMLGYQQGELAGNHTTWEKLLHPNDRKKAIRKVMNAVSNCAVHYEHEFRLKHKFEGYRLIRSFGSVVSTDINGKAARAVGTQVDITEYHLAEMQLRQQEYALNTSSIVSIANAQGIMTHVNEKFCRISGYSAAQLIGKNYKVVHSGFHPSLFWREMFTTTAKGISWRREICNKAKNGTLFWLDTTIVGLFDENNQLEKYISISSDITQRKLAEQQLAQAKSEAEQASRHKSDFLANMSHEIRTPMNAIVGMGHLLAATELSEKQQDYISKMQTAGQSLLTLINDILDFSKIEAGKLHLESIDFDLNEVLNQISDLFRFEIERKGLELVFKITADTPVLLIGDPLRLRQILINLVNNAVKFTEQGVITISVSVQQIRTSTTRLRFSVQDQGIGIEAGQLARLFDSFYQTDNSTTRHYGGTGLGLAICKNLVNLMDGEISAESEPGQGSQFSITAEFGMRQQKTFKHLFDEPGLKGLRVLLVEASDQSGNAMRDLLVSLSFTVAVARDYEQAISIADNADKNFDLVLFGLKFQDHEYIDAIQQIKQAIRLMHVPIILITQGQTLIDESKLSVQGVLLKPVAPSSLFDAIIKVFSDHSQLNQMEHDSHSSLKQSNTLEVDLLLVEDNAVNRQVAEELLLNYGCSVDIAENGEIAIDRVQKKRYDLVLMDIQMPVMDGLVATQKIRGLGYHSDLPIIAMTAHAMQGDRQKSIAAGMNDHITKPIAPDQLYQMLCHWLPGKTMSRNMVAIDSDTLCHELPVNSPLIDMEIGLKRVGGKRKLLRKLLQEFYLDHLDDPQKLKAAFENSDFVQAERLLHTLIGVLGNIGAESLFSQGRKLEHLVRQPLNAQTRHALDVFINDYHCLLKALEPLLDKEITYYPSHEITDKLNIEQDLEKLKSLIQKGDFDALLYFDSVEKLLLSSYSLESIQTLKNALENYDFDIALELIQQLELPA